MFQCDADDGGMLMTADDMVDFYSIFSCASLARSTWPSCCDILRVRRSKVYSVPPESSLPNPRDSTKHRCKTGKEERVLIVSCVVPLSVHSSF
jgi:hypothetical protein